MELDNNNRAYTTDQLVITPQTGLVTAADQTVRLGPVNMRVLLCLIDQQGQVVSRADIFTCVWGDQVVSDDTLTRCISDLRNQLGKLTDTVKLIETIPKRGYRWLPEVTPNQHTTQNTAQATATETSTDTRKFALVNWAIAIALFAILLAASSNWLAGRESAADITRIALLPLQTENTVPDDVTARIEETLQMKSLATVNLRFLSASAVNSRPHNPYPYFSRQFGVQWIIEGKVRKHQNRFKVSLSLVDSTMATVYYTKSELIENSQIEAYCENFLQELTRTLSGKQQ